MKFSSIFYIQIQKKVLEIYFHLKNVFINYIIRQYFFASYNEFTLGVNSS